MHTPSNGPPWLHFPDRRSQAAPAPQHSLFGNDNGPAEHECIPDKPRIEAWLAAVEEPAEELLVEAWQLQQRRSEVPQHTHPMPPSQPTADPLSRFYASEAAFLEVEVAANNYIIAHLQQTLRSMPPQPTELPHIMSLLVDAAFLEAEVAANNLVIAHLERLYTITREV